MDNLSVIESVFVVRADFGKWAKEFFNGGYVGITWLPDTDLTDAEDRGKDYVRDLYSTYEPSASLMRKAQNVGQIWRFLTEIMPQTLVLTPSEDRAKLMVGLVSGNYYYDRTAKDSPFPHCKPVKWQEQPLLRSALSVPLQNTLGSSLTVFKIEQATEVLTALALPIPGQITAPSATAQDLKHLTLDRILQLSADEFEILITQILAAIGFEAQHVGKSGDGGIDIIGVLDVFAFAEVNLTVQVKRYSTNTISHQVIRQFRGSVPEKSQAAFVTTSDFTKAAREEAIREGYKKIGLINGLQLVDLLVEHYDALSLEIKERLRLRRTLMPE